MSGLQMIYTVVLKEHYENRGSQKTFAGKYDCHKLVFRIADDPPQAGGIVFVG